MANGEAEKKNIAKLEFNIQGAISDLETIDNKLKSIASSSEAYAKKIGTNLKGSIDVSNMINTKDLEKNLTSATKLTEKQVQKLSYVEQKANIEKNAKIEADNIKHQNRLEEINQRQLKSTQTIYEKISNYAKTYLIYQGFNELKSATSELIQEMVDLEYQMVQIERVLNDSSLDIDNYRDRLIQLAYDYGNSFDNVADITLRLAQAGFDANESLALTEKTLLALNTAELNATQATSDMVAVMSQWGLMTGTANEQAKAYGEIIDKINKVADNFPTTSEDILNALKKTSSAFNLAGASIDETIAMITAAEVASQRGGKAIGTAMNSIIQQLKDAGRLSTMESLGLDVYTDTTKSEFKSIIEIIAQLSEKMEQLKKEGKENSVEMQNLLEVFTVFRRNVGAGLLNEMAGEDSTYAQVLNTSLNSVGYSLQENEKHMKTAKAAQEQFNAELLKLKTSVWEGGVEEVFRSILLLGTNAMGGIKQLTDTFGALPVAIGAATLALSLLSKKMKLASYDAEKGTINVKGFIGSIGNIKANVKEINRLQNSLRGVSNTSKVSFGTMVKNMTAYGAKATMATAKTLALKTATMALNVAASLAATAGIMLLTTAIQEMMSKQAAAIQLQEDAIQSTEEQVEKQQEQVESLKEMISTYDELGNKQSKTPEEVTKLYEIQTKIKNILGEQAETIDLINGKYEDQRKILDKISIEEQEKLVEEKRKLYEQKANAGVGYELPSWVSKTFGDKDYEKVLGDYFPNQNLKEYMESMDVQEAIGQFEQWEKVLREVQSESVEMANTYNWVTTVLNDLKNNTKEETEALEDLNEESAKLDIMKMFPEGSIKNAEDFQNAIKRINEESFETANLAEYRERLENIIYDQYPEFATQAELAAGNLSFLDTTLNTHLTSLQNYADQYAILRNAQDEYNESGQLTISTLQNLINNDLLQYLSLQNGQLQINAQSMLDAAEGVKVKAIEELKDAAAMDIQKLATGDLNSISNVAKGAIAGVGTNAEVAGNKAQTASGQILELAASIDAAVKAGEGNLGEGLNLENFKQQAQAIKDAYMGIAKNISAINITSASYSPQTARSSGSSGSSSAAAAQAKREAEAAAKAAQEAEEKAYKERLEKFKDYMDEKERLEKRWVDKQKELGLLSNEDYLYITQQRIERHKKYLEEIKKATWMNQEDRLELEKEYSEKIEDLQVDYIGYLKEQLDEEISAIEEANEKKIDLIEEEADKRIEALRKVEDENDRIRTKEEYLQNRKTHLDDIAYWEQRTGREAQEALKEAKANLEELDKEWEQQLEDWSIEDQIKAIEEERDAQIKAIEDTQAAEIKSIEDIYDAKVKLFAETGQIIYEGSVIQSQNLYNAYKENFIDPISKDLANLNKVEAPVTPSTPQTPQQQYETYTIKYGDTLSQIARNFGTTIEKIMAANPYVTNKNRIYAGKTLQIPKFHEGGIVGGNQEAFALLKPHEVILKPEWADGINKLAKLARTNENSITNNSTVIEVKGDLVRIDANIKDKTDAEYLTRRVEKILKDKFNIKK